MTRIERIYADLLVRMIKSAKIRSIRVIRVPIKSHATAPKAPSRNRRLW